MTSLRAALIFAALSVTRQMTFLAPMLSKTFLMTPSNGTERVVQHERQEELLLAVRQTVLLRVFRFLFAACRKGTERLQYEKVRFQAYPQDSLLCGSRLINLVS